MEIQSPFKLPEDQLRHANFYDFFTKSIKQYGSKLALIDSNTGWSCNFDQIESCVESCYQYFRRNGLDKHSRPALVSLNCPEVLFAELAAAQLGFDLTHASPLATVDELAGCLTTAKCNVIITQPEHKQKLEQVLKKVSLCKRIVLLPDQGSLLSRKDHHGGGDFSNATRKPIRPINLIFFSSGTTGPPKAFQIPFDAKPVSVAQCRAQPWWRAPDSDSKTERLLVVLPMMHNLAVMYSYIALCKGHRLITLPRFVPDRFLEAMQKYQITYLYLVPPLVNFLASDPLVDRYDLSHLHSVTSGAAPLPPNVAAKCKERLRLKDMRQLWGMTEIRGSTWTPYGYENYGSIGIPMPGVVIKLVDPDTDKPIWNPFEQGELWVSGPHCGGTYFENDKANRETFVTEGDVTWCKTGDIGYFDEAGFLYLTDRQKDLIKYKGLQVSPSEIESVLREHPDVLDCAVIGKPDEQAGEVPVAFVKLKHGSSVNGEELNRLVKGRLSSFKQLTGGVIFTDELPRSNTGKILKRTLRDMLAQHQQHAAASSEKKSKL